MPKADSNESARIEPREFEASHRAVVIVIAVFVLGLIGTALAAILIPFGVAEELDSLGDTHTRIINHIRQNDQWPADWAQLGVTADNPELAPLMDRVIVNWNVTIDEVAAMIRDRGVDTIMSGKLTEYDDWEGLELVQFAPSMDRYASEEHAANRAFAYELAGVLIARNLLYQADE